MLKRRAEDQESGRAVKQQAKSKSTNSGNKGRSAPWNEAFVVGKAAFAEGKYDIALERFNQAVNLDTTNNTTLLDCRAATYEKLGDLSAALSDAKNIIKLAPKQSRGYLRAGKIFTMQGQTQRSRKIYERAIQLVDPNDSRYASLVQLEKSLPKQTKRRCRDFVQILPYDVLTLIFGQISSFPRLIQCMHVSRSWRHFLHSWPGSWRHLDFASIKTSSTMLKHFMSMVTGKHVQKFSYADGNATNVLKLLIERDCHYLQALELFHCTVSKNALIRTLRLMGRQLTHLTLSFNRFEPDYDMHEIFRTCPKLTHFIWEGAEKFLSQSRLDLDLNITHLKISISSGGTVPERYLLPILRRCRRLKSLVLGLEMYEHTDQMAFSRIMELCPNLVSYRTDGIIDDWDKYNEYQIGLRQIMIPERAWSFHDESLFQAIEQALPTLQMLDIRGIHASAKRVLQKLSTTNASDLKVLMMALATDVIEQDLIEAFDSCPNLELLRLKSMPGVTNGVLQKLGQLESLRYLDISSCAGVTGAGLQALVDNASSLGGLKLVNCINIRADAVEYVRDKLGWRSVEYRLSTT